MRKIILFCLTMIVIFSLFGCSANSLEPRILKETTAMPQNKGTVIENPGTDLDGMYRVDLTSAVVSESEWLKDQRTLDYIRFNTRTTWPQNMPEGLDPNMFVENGKNPGLGIRDLHKQGIDGRGISIGIVDMTLYTGHNSYKKNLLHYEAIPKNDLTHHMHGPAVASLAVGKETGVAPASNLFFIEVMWEDNQAKEGETTYRYYAQAIERFLNMNKELPENDRIRVISISAYPSPEHGVNDYDLYAKALERAKEEGVFVIAVSSYEDYGFKFAGLEREPSANPNDVRSYSATGPEAWLEDGRIFFPMNSRTPASFEGENDYTFFRRGGASWITPYIAGLYALSAQVKPDVTPELFWASLENTADHIIDKTTKKEILIVNPVALISDLSGKTYTKSFVSNPPAETNVQKVEQPPSAYSPYTNFLVVANYKLEPLLISKENFSIIDLPTYTFDEIFKFEGAESEAIAILETAKNPGLGVRRLHEKGLTGKGVRVGIIDQNLLVSHPEYKDNIVAYFDSGCNAADDIGSYHGASVTSILCGKTIGVAPEAIIYYAAAPSWEKDARYFAECLDWMIEENEKLPENDKIRLVSVSSAPTSDNNWYKNGETWTDAVNRAEAAGIMIIDCRSKEETAFVFSSYLDGTDPEDVTQYRPFYPNRNDGYERSFWESYIFAPASKRTLAREYRLGETGYRYEGVGGQSWSVPYISGVLALGCQVAPDMSMNKLKELLFMTAWETPDGYKMVDPVAFVEAVEKAKQSN